MKNRGFIQVVTVLLFLASAYQLWFTFKTTGIEKDAEAKAEQLHAGDEVAKAAFVKSYLDSMESVEVYSLGFASFTYQDCKENELNLGLDLQGGMNVILEVDIPTVVRTMAGETENKEFLAAFTTARDEYLGEQNFVDLLAAKYNATGSSVTLANIFFNKDLEGQLPNGYESTDEEIITFLKAETNGAISRAFEIISTRIDKFGVAQPNIQQLENGRILVELPGVDDPERVRKILQSSAKLEFWNTYFDYQAYNFLLSADKIVLGENAIEELTETDSTEEASVAETTEEVEEGALEENTGSLEDGSLVADDSSAEAVDSNAQLTAEEFRAQAPVSSLIIPAPLLSQSQNWPGRALVGNIRVSDTAEFNKYINSPSITSTWPSTLHWKYGFKSRQGQNGEAFLDVYAVKSDRNNQPALAGDVITDARPTRQQNLELAVSMSMNQEGTNAWKRITTDASSSDPNECVAVVLDGAVYSAPIVNEPIPNGTSLISGGFDVKQAEDLANILKAGKLPAPTRISGESTVGPTLGEKAIRAGLLSLAVGFVLVILFMMLYYGKSGVYAVIALLANLLFIVGILAGLGASLTLPGMAGLVLTIGMAVDANVLIFERVREELQAGRGLKSAIKDGYAGAYSSIIDANITTVIAGVILWMLGRGPVLGFAVILVIGILSSLFTSIFLTRLFIDGDIAKNRETTFYSSFSKKLSYKLNAVNWDFIGKRKIFYIVSGIIILAGVASLATRGVSLGVDFKGGWSYVVHVDGSNSETIREAMNNGFQDGANVNNEVKTYGTNDQYKITTSYMIESKDSMVASKVEAEVVNALSDLGVTAESILSSSKVGPTIAKDTKSRSSLAILFAIVGMFLYILARFRNVGFGLGATAAIFHDVLIVFSLYSLLWGILPFELAIDQAFIAAILTVVGYSINDTVVVFDRVREFMNSPRNTGNTTDVINKAINTTLSRTLITSLTTLLVILILFIFGGEGLAGFTFALLIGVAVGTYSSVCIATPIVVDYLKARKK